MAYTREAFEKSYLQAVHPLLDADFNPTTDKVVVLPPILHTKRCRFALFRTHLNAFYFPFHMGTLSFKKFVTH